MLTLAILLVESRRVRRKAVAGTFRNDAAQHPAFWSAPHVFSKRRCDSTARPRPSGRTYEGIGGPSKPLSLSQPSQGFDCLNPGGVGVSHWGNPKVFDRQQRFLALFPPSCSALNDGEILVRPPCDTSLLLVAMGPSRPNTSQRRCGL